MDHQRAQRKYSESVLSYTPRHSTAAAAIQATAKSNCEPTNKNNSPKIVRKASAAAATKHTHSCDDPLYEEMRKAMAKYERRLGLKSRQSAPNRVDSGTVQRKNSICSPKRSPLASAAVHRRVTEVASAHPVNWAKGRAASESEKYCEEEIESAVLTCAEKLKSLSLDGVPSCSTEIVADARRRVHTELAIERPNSLMLQQQAKRRILPVPPLDRQQGLDLA